MDSDDISDPTDWKDTRLPALAALDSSLRCQICKDFYNSPVITSCLHTFCSLCIRRCLTADQICPICRARDEEVKLRKNNAVQEILDAFLAVRRSLMDVVKDKVVVEEEVAKIVETLAPSMEERVDNKKRDDEETSRKSTRTSTRPARSSQRPQYTEQPINVIEIDDSTEHDSDYDPIEDDGRVERSLSHKKVKTKTLPLSPPTPIDDGLQACPICAERFKPEKINRHLDECLSSGALGLKKKQTTLVPPSPSTRATKSFQPPPPPPSEREAYTSEEQSKLRLAKLNYTLLKEAALRSKLQDLGLKGVGNKATLEKRHTEWVNIWNANLDSATPKSKSALLKDLDQLEKEQQRSKMNPTKKEEFTASGWAKKHSSEFDELVRQARSKKQKTGDGDEEKNDEKKEDELEPSKEIRDDEREEQQRTKPDFISPRQQTVELKGYDESPYFVSAREPIAPSVDVEMAESTAV